MDNEKKEEFETPKVLNLQGKELNDEALEDVSGGLEEVAGACSGGGCCGGS